MPPSTTAPDLTPPGPQLQLSEEEFKELNDKLTDVQRRAIREAAGPFVSCRENTLRGLRKRGLVHASLGRLQNLTPLGMRLRAAIEIPPGTFGSRVVQDLLDGGLSWRLLPGGGLRGKFEIESSGSGARLHFRMLNGTPHLQMMADAEEILTAAGYEVQHMESRTPSLLVNPLHA